MGWPAEPDRVGTSAPGKVSPRRKRTESPGTSVLAAVFTRATERHAVASVVPAFVSSPAALT